MNDNISTEKRKAIVLKFYELFREFPAVSFKDTVEEYELYTCISDNHKYEIAIKMTSPGSYTYTSDLWFTDLQFKKAA